MEFCVELDAFSGPLDLMLHLVSKNKLDLMDLDLDLLADQYILYIHQMRKKELDIASEYLSEFAWLLEYKSRRLLPRPVESLPDDYEQSQKELLQQRLLEYQQYKEAALQLERKAASRNVHLNRPADSLLETWRIPREEFHTAQTPYRLIQAMKRVLYRQALLNPWQTSLEVRELSVEERMVQLEEKLQTMPERFDLGTLCRDVDSLREVIVTFLAVLELLHQQKISCQLPQKQEGTIWLCKMYPCRK